MICLKSKPIEILVHLPLLNCQSTATPLTYLKTPAATPAYCGSYDSSASFQLTLISIFIVSWGWELETADSGRTELWIPRATPWDWLQSMDSLEMPWNFLLPLLGPYIATWYCFSRLTIAILGQDCWLRMYCLFADPSRSLNSDPWLWSSFFAVLFWKQIGFH